MKELDLIHEASQKLRALTSDTAPIINVTLRKRTFDAACFELSKLATHNQAIKLHSPNNYFLYKGLTFIKG